MRVTENNLIKIKTYIDNLRQHIEKNAEVAFEKYVKLGPVNVKIVSYHQDFLPLMQRQISYSMTDEKLDCVATIVLWNEKDTISLTKEIIQNNEALKTRFRLEQVLTKATGGVMQVEWMCEQYSKHNPVVRFMPEGFVEAHDVETNTYYYGVKDLSFEEFIKQGHIFVQMFNKILKTETTNLVHGAVVGLDNNGILFCARGQRGKSTLAVLAMMQGFEYVSDDYLILQKEGQNLYSYPIYSIITLSPKMYGKLYDDIKGKFVCNNARKDKYVINIDAYHNQFKDKYPIKVCMFPEIVPDEKPSIVECKKGRAITQLIHSTVKQTQDAHDIKTIQKLIGFLKDFKFYQINLCPDINENVKCLRQFCENMKKN